MELGYAEFRTWNPFIFDRGAFDGSTIRATTQVIAHPRGENPLCPTVGENRSSVSLFSGSAVTHRPGALRTPVPPHSSLVIHTSSRRCPGARNRSPNAYIPSYRVPRQEGMECRLRFGFRVLIDVMPALSHLRQLAVQSYVHPQAHSRRDDAINRFLVRGSATQSSLPGTPFSRRPPGFDRRWRLARAATCGDWPSNASAGMSHSRLSLRIISVVSARAPEKISRAAALARQLGDDLVETAPEQVQLQGKAT